MKKIVMKALVVALLCSGSVSAGIIDTLTGGAKKVKESTLNTFKSGTKTIQRHIDSLNGKDPDVEDLKRSMNKVNDGLAEGTRSAVRSAGNTLQRMSERFDDGIEYAMHVSEEAKKQTARDKARKLAEDMKTKYRK